MELITFTNDSNYEVKRNYTIASFSFSDFDESDKQNIIESANQLINLANNSAANSGQTRNMITKENDAYAGILAEFATLYYLKRCDKVLYAYRPNISDLSNQIDIAIEYESKNGPISLTAEVRSSFVRNGIDFALFKTNKENETYFDLIGPYYQKNYKSEYEPIKDLYFRVLFSGIKYDIRRRFLENDEPFFLIGYQSGEYILKHGYKKNLLSGSAITKKGDITGDYIVLPIDQIIDLSEPFTALY